jgi:hypothetical protein
MTRGKDDPKFRRYIFQFTVWQAVFVTVSSTHRNQSINRKGNYILAGIHGMDHFCPKLAPQPI